MDKAKKTFYRYCIVPKCKNTIRSTPNKIFFPVPRDAKVRKQWCKLMRRDEVSSKSCLYCCEDHFNIEEDTVNYVQYNIMKQQGEKVSLRLMGGVVPHIFQCQKQNVNPELERKNERRIKRQRLALVNEALSEYAVKRSHVLEICKPPQTSAYKTEHSSQPDRCDDYQAIPSSFHMNVSHEYDTKPSISHIEDCDNVENVEKLYCDKAVQVNIKTKYRSKGIQVCR